MPKVVAIIEQIKNNCPNVLPDITQTFNSDPEQIAEAQKERGRSFQYYAMLRMLLSQVLKQLKRSDFIKPLLQINISDIPDGQFKNQARIAICQGIIVSGDQYRTNNIDKHLADLATQKLNTRQNAKVQIINAGNNFLKGDYLKASVQYLAAARMQAFVRDQQKRTELIGKSIAFAFISPIASQTHKVVCTLCLNQFSKRSKLYGLVVKMYRQDIITREQIDLVEAHLPSLLRAKDSDGISKIVQAAFSRNMIPIINSFSSIKIETLLRLLAIQNEEELLILLEKTYLNGQVSIDQIEGYIYLKSNIVLSDVIKDFLTQIDNVLQEQ